MMPMLTETAVFVLGALVVVGTLSSAVRTFVLPRGAASVLTGTVFIVLRFFFETAAKPARTYAGRDRVMALYAPVTLVSLPLVWVSLVMMGYTGLFWALDVRPWSAAFKVSGSSLLTLGFAPVDTLPTIVLAFSEATIGLGIVALLIAYLPTMYTAFSRRETAVALLEVRAGSPPSSVEMIERFHRLEWLDHLESLWVDWEAWFADLEESHTSLAALVYFRSSHPDRSWITAAGTVLDAASLIASSVDVPRTPQAELCIRAGYVALRRIADFFGIKYDPDPAPTDPISITREEFDEVYDRLAAAGVPLKPDRDRAWRDFAGWRVNYDTVLLSLANLTMAPYAPWSSDRSPPGARPPGLRRRWLRLLHQ